MISRGDISVRDCTRAKESALPTCDHRSCVHEWGIVTCARVPDSIRYRTDLSLGAQVKNSMLRLQILSVAPGYNNYLCNSYYSEGLLSIYGFYN